MEHLRILIVDDSAFVRKVIKQMLAVRFSTCWRRSRRGRALEVEASARRHHARSQHAQDRWLELLRQMARRPVASWWEHCDAMANKRRA